MSVKIEDAKPHMVCECWDSAKGTSCGEPATVRITNSSSFCSKCVSDLSVDAKKRRLNEEAIAHTAIREDGILAQALSHVKCRSFEESQKSTPIKNKEISTETKTANTRYVDIICHIRNVHSEDTALEVTATLSVSPHELYLAAREPCAVIGHILKSVAMCPGTQIDSTDYKKASSNSQASITLKMLFAKHTSPHNAITNAKTYVRRVLNAASIDMGIKLILVASCPSDSE